MALHSSEPPRRRTVLIAAGTILVLLSFMTQASSPNPAPPPADAGTAAILNIIPKPWKTEVLPGRFVFSRDTVVVLEDNWKETAPVAAYLADNLAWGTGGGPKIGEPRLLPGGAVGSAIRLTLRAQNTELGDEGYILRVSPAEIRLEANAAAGLFYGVQTLRQALRLEPDGTLSLPCLLITDRPRFGWRGMLLDCGRHFMSKEFVKRYIDLLAVHKMNRFHWHLTEDQGWRIAIPGYPRLTEVGAWRVGTARNMLDMVRNHHDGVSHGGFYTADEIREVVAYAAERQITVVPEIEMPGHSLAALAAYPEFSCTGGPFEVATRFGIFKDVYCPGKEATFAFLQDVLGEVMRLFPGPYIHIGGDEAPKARWKTCPDCQRRIAQEGLADEHELQIYFTNRIASYLAAHGRTLIGWNEALSPDLHPQAIIQYWVRNRDAVVAAICEGRKTIISSYLDYYLDHSHSLTPLSRIYQFEPVFAELSASEAENILGVEAPLWTEFVPNRARLDFQVFPRLLAVAETGWTAHRQKDLEDFRTRLKEFELRLEALDIRYARSRDVEPSRLKRLFGLFTIAQPQRRTAG